MKTFKPLLCLLAAWLAFAPASRAYLYVSDNPWTLVDPQGLRANAIENGTIAYTGSGGGGGAPNDIALGGMIMENNAGISLQQIAVVWSQQYLANLAGGPAGGAAAKEVNEAAPPAQHMENTAAEAAAHTASPGAAPAPAPSNPTMALAEAMNADAKANAAAAPSASAKAVAEGEVGTYGNLKARSVVGDGLDIHEVPSSAAQVAAKEAELGRKLTDAEKAALKNSNPAIAVKADTHKLTDTYGAKNTPAKIQQDAANLPAAAARGAADVVKAGQTTGSDLSGSAKKLQDMTPSN